MDIKERRMFEKIYKTHLKLVQRLNLGDDDYWKIVKRYRDYHNEANYQILQIETKGR